MLRRGIRSADSHARPGHRGRTQGCQLHSSRLEQEGYAVDVLHDGDGAGAQAQMIDYDCVVLDLMLPGRSGFQVLRDIRAKKADAARC